MGKCGRDAHSPWDTQGVVASRRHGPCEEQGQPLGDLLLLISWANVGGTPTLLGTLKEWWLSSCRYGRQAGRAMASRLAARRSRGAGGCE